MLQSKAHADPRGLEHTRARRASRVICGWACAAAGCADLLGLPSEPRLVNAPVAPASGDPGSPTDSAVVVHAPQPDAPLPTAPMTEAAMMGVLPLSMSVSDAPDSSDPSARDGGTPDVGGPTPDAAACAALQSLGPDGECYAVLTSLLSWVEARQSCQSLGEGWDLASIRSARANEFVLGLLTAETWLGATDAAEKGAWLWINDGQRFWQGNGDTGSAVSGAYTNWNRTEPNGADSDCARIVPALNGIWADLECTAARAAVCAGPPL